MAYAFKNPATGSLRVDVNLDENGNIATGSAETAGAKSVTFSNVSTTATADELNSGSKDSVEEETAGLLFVFIKYLLGGRYVIASERRTIIQTVEEVA